MKKILFLHGFYASGQCVPAVALREALKTTLNALKTLSKNHSEDLPEDVRALLGEVAFNVNAALSAPRRNCDVGTAEEQGERCLAQFDQWRREGDGRKLITAIMAWVQMPYNEEGGEK